MHLYEDGCPGGGALYWLCMWTFRGWDWDGIVILNALTFASACLLYNYPSNMFSAGLEWLLFFLSVRATVSECRVLSVAIRKLKGCVGTVTGTCFYVLHVFLKRQLFAFFSCVLKLARLQ